MGRRVEAGGDKGGGWDKARGKVALTEYCAQVRFLRVQCFTDNEFLQLFLTILHRAFQKSILN